MPRRLRIAVRRTLSALGVLLVLTNAFGLHVHADDATHHDHGHDAHAHHHGDQHHHHGDDRPSEPAADLADDDLDGDAAADDSHEFEAHSHGSSDIAALRGTLPSLVTMVLACGILPPPAQDLPDDAPRDVEIPPV